MWGGNADLHILTSLFFFIFFILHECIRQTCQLQKPEHLKTRIVYLSSRWYLEFGEILNLNKRLQEWNHNCLWLVKTAVWPITLLTIPSWTQSGLWSGAHLALTGQQLDCWLRAALCVHICECAWTPVHVSAFYSDLNCVRKGHHVWDFSAQISNVYSYDDL